MSYDSCSAFVTNAFAAATELLSKREDRPGLQAAIALYATGTLAALALALTFALEKGWLTIALALMSLGTAWISLQRPIPFLRTLAAILAGIVVLRIGYEPRIVGSAVGTTPIVNWLLWGYGVPALSFWAGAHFLRRNGDDAPLRSVEAAAILFTVLLAFMEIRHFINNGDVYRQSAGLTEVALQVCVALAMAIGLERLRMRSGSMVHDAGAVLLTLFAGPMPGRALPQERNIHVECDHATTGRAPARRRARPERDHRRHGELQQGIQVGAFPSDAGNGVAHSQQPPGQPRRFPVPAAAADAGPQRAGRGAGDEKPRCAAGLFRGRSGGRRGFARYDQGLERKHQAPNFKLHSELGL